MSVSDYLQLLLLAAASRRAERYRVEHSRPERELLLDRGIVAKADGIVALGHDEEHVVLCGAGLDVLDGSGGFPVGDCVWVFQLCAV